MKNQPYIFAIVKETLNYNLRLNHQFDHLRWHQNRVRCSFDCLQDQNREKLPRPKNVE